MAAKVAQAVNKQQFSEEEQQHKQQQQQTQQVNMSSIDNKMCKIYDIRILLIKCAKINVYFLGVENTSTRIRWKIPFLPKSRTSGNQLWVFYYYYHHYWHWNQPTMIVCLSLFSAAATFCSPTAGPTAATAAASAERIWWLGQSPGFKRSWSGIKCWGLHQAIHEGHVWRYVYMFIKRSVISPNTIPTLSSSCSILNSILLI